MSTHTEPPAKQFTREQLIASARAWMLDLWGEPTRQISSDKREQYYAQLGLLCDFIYDQFSPPTTGNPAGTTDGFPPGA